MLGTLRDSGFDVHFSYLFGSIRLMFSVAAIGSEQEFENEDVEDENEENTSDPMHIRASPSISKVCTSSILFVCHSYE